MKNILFAICLLLTACTHDDTAAKKQMLRQAATVRIKKVLTQVAADCEANLLKETYKRVQQLQKQARRPVAR
jgi:hypothetical protein